MLSSSRDSQREFMSNKGSKLGSIFGVDQSSGQEHASFTFTAPKQPKKKDRVQEDAPHPKVLAHCAVQAYKYVNNKYTSQGPLGAALIESLTTTTTTTTVYSMLLYENKQHQVTSASITPSFIFTIQANNYASFYDDSSQMWSIMFETPEKAEQFAKEIAMMKANSESLEKLIQQDLSLGDGRAIEDGDSVEVKYIGWLLENRTFGLVFDQSGEDKLFRFEVGKGKVVKGWDQGMLGMKRRGHRLLIIPPTLAYGTKRVNERIPPNSSLIIEVKVIRLKLQNVDFADSPSELPTTAKLPMMLPLPDRNEMDEPEFKGRMRSISELPLHSPDSKKAKLISRVARMGQPMFLSNRRVAADVEESDEEMSPPPVPVKPAVRAKPRSISEIGMTSHVRQTACVTQALGTMGQPSVPNVESHPVVVSFTSDVPLQQPPVFLQNLPDNQQLAVYHNPNAVLQQTALLQQQNQQQQAVLLQQQQVLQQQQLQQQQQQLLGNSLSAAANALPQHSSVFGAAHLPIPTHQTPSSPSSTTADSIAPVLLTEYRQQTTDIRLGLSTMSDKIDQILEKVEDLRTPRLPGHDTRLISPYGGGGRASPSMGAHALMHNVTRVAKENDQLMLDIQEQSSKVREQREKLSTILDSNQRYEEQNQDLQGLRSDRHKNSPSQSQAKIIFLEGEKIHLASELNTASAKISTLQIELGEYKKREEELKQQFKTNSASSSSARDELARLRLQKDEDDQRIDNLNAKIRDENQIRKKLEVKLASHEEELAEIRANKLILERNINERKRKTEEERKKLEKDLEDSKQNYEGMVVDLQEKLRKQKSSIDAEIHSKVSKAENDISQEWESKSDRMIITVTDKHNRQILDWKNEKEELTSKISELEKKLVTSRSTGSKVEKQITQLKDELAEMKLWKDKYGSLRTQAAVMKERYERKVKEFEREKEEDERTRSEVVEKSKEQREQQQQKLQELQQQYDNQCTQTTSLKEQYEKRIQEIEREKNEVEEKRIQVVEKARKLRQRNQQKIQQLQQNIHILQQEALERQSELSAARDTETARRKDRDEVEDQGKRLEGEEIKGVPIAVPANVPRTISIDVPMVASTVMPTADSSNVPVPVSIDVPMVASTVMSTADSANVPVPVSIDVPIVASTVMPTADSSNVPVPVSIDVPMVASTVMSTADSANVPVPVSIDVPIVALAIATTMEHLETSNESTGTSNESTGTSNESTGTSNESTGTRNESTGTSNESTGTSNESTATSNESTGTSNESTGTSNECPFTNSESPIDNKESPPETNTASYKINIEVTETEGECIVPQNDIVPEIEEAVPKNEELLTESKETVPEMEVTVPAIKESVPEIEQTVPQEIEAFVPEIEEVVPEIEETLQKIEEILPEIEEVVPEIEETVQKIEEILPEIEEVVPEIEETVQKIEEILPEIEEVVPEIEETVQKIEEILPEIEEVVPEIEEVVPDIEEDVPEMKETIPEIEELLREIDETVSEIEETVSEIKEFVPEIEEVVPVLVPEIEELVPEIEEVVPEIEEVVPVLVPEIEEFVPEIEEVVQEIEEVVPVLVPEIEEFVPEIEEVVPEVEEVLPEIVPEIDKTVTEIEETVPEIEEVVPEIEEVVLEVVPEIDKTVTEIEETVPHIEEVVPEIEEVVPEIEEVVPEVEHVVPEIDKAVPEMEQTMPESEEFVLDIDTTVPEVEVTVPETCSVKNEKNPVLCSNAGFEDIVIKSNDTSLSLIHARSSDVDIHETKQDPLEVNALSKTVKKQSLQESSLQDGNSLPSNLHGSNSLGNSAQESTSLESILQENICQEIDTTENILQESISQENTSQDINLQANSTAISPPPKLESSVKWDITNLTEQAKRDNEEEDASKPVRSVKISPCLFDEDDDDSNDDSPLFKDSLVFDTIWPDMRAQQVSSASKHADSNTASGVPVSQVSGGSHRKPNFVNEEVQKPRPSLFGDDSDDDNVDWLV